MDEKLQRLLERVDSEESFVNFLECLSQDWYEAQRNEVELSSTSDESCNNDWENGTIGSYLEAAATWADASKNGLAYYKKPDNPWRRAAEIVYMGKLYE